ncbi:MAG: hypothetical protein HQK81_10620 [Desulfovibrionaceae bacterium]|nr:hypothetical protein [Desulfovibrionaceae bacterium]MBF0514495.1 hypothetical protein [Desulfovibrionaceae bacterium]
MSYRHQSPDQAGASDAASLSARSKPVCICERRTPAACVRKRPAAHQLAPGLMARPGRVKRIFGNRLVMKIYHSKITVFFISQKLKSSSGRLIFENKSSRTRRPFAAKPLSRTANAAVSQPRTARAGSENNWDKPGVFAYDSILIDKTRRE